MTTQKVREYLKSLMKNDMSKEEIETIDAHIKELDKIDEDFENKDKELKECKDIIINQIRNSGNTNQEIKEEETPKEPRTFEEIAQAKIQKGE